MNPLRQVGLNVRRLRLQRGLSQEQAAFESGIAFNYLSGIETGKRNPSVKVLAGIAKALRVHLADFFAPIPPGYESPKNLPRGKNVHHQGRRAPKPRKR